MTGSRPTTAVLRVLAGEPVWPLPIWLMRQAGRYLPEYREVRARAPWVRRHVDRVWTGLRLRKSRSKRNKNLKIQDFFY